MDESIRRKIEARAHEIWEQEGRPHDRGGVHWAQAEREVLDQMQADDASALTADDAAKPVAGTGPIVETLSPEAAGSEETKPKRAREGKSADPVTAPAGEPPAKAPKARKKKA
ncbi:MAG: DUF2934 domain-containing protein [Geminicoccaceae bacterium]|nr:DUF2934 domain-containing protein [Geminicoccaceae bacterium]